MIYEWHDFVGNVGVFLILLSTVLVRVFCASLCILISIFPG